jgi:hypothetical protein
LRLPSPACGELRPSRSKRPHDINRVPSEKLNERAPLRRRQGQRDHPHIEVVCKRASRLLQKGIQKPQASSSLLASRGTYCGILVDRGWTQPVCRSECRRTC